MHAREPPHSRTIAVVLVACAACSHQPPTTASPDAGLLAHPAAHAPTTASSAAIALGPTPDNVCESIYLLTSTGALLRFSPTLMRISSVGALGPCGLGSEVRGDPISFAVERSGQAWVPRSNGRIASVNVHDASCFDTPFVPHQAGFAMVNLALAGDTLVGADDHGWGGDTAPSLGLALIDRATWKLTRVGHARGDRMHLAGTSAGALYAASPGAIEQIDRTTYAATDLHVEPLEKASGAPMAYYRGALWIFGGFTGVLRVDLATKRVEQVADATYLEPLRALNVRIDGAGAAACDVDAAK